MKVVLLKNVVGTGNAGMVCEVKEGYFKNYLSPKGLAATLDNPLAMKIIQDTAKREAAKAKELGLILEKANTIDGETLEIKAKANPKGQLYAAITREIVEKMLAEKFGIKPEKVEGLPIKNVGIYDVVLHFANQAVARIRVKVEL